MVSSITIYKETGIGQRVYNAVERKIELPETVVITDKEQIEFILETVEIFNYTDEYYRVDIHFEPEATEYNEYGRIDAWYSAYYNSEETLPGFVKELF